MDRKDEILAQTLEANGMLTKITPNDAFWNVITRCMQIHVEEQDVQRHKLTIREVTKSKQNSKVKPVSSCNHKWLPCGNSFFICDKCPEWKSL